MTETTLKVEIVNISENGCCNFCSKGKVSSTGRALIFPYSEVAQVSSKSQSMNFCKECFELLTKMKYGKLHREVI